MEIVDIGGIAAVEERALCEKGVLSGILARHNVLCRCHRGAGEFRGVRLRV